ncbi:ABC transporter substrate-binding protein [Haladaptatus sp. CMSO5]|uniref:ABC transporter substrate-binding protein n=1 Tax=Haladaptatus sp. CMSO5 TaxID=3120514 RepID=UPI002FCE43F8
MTLDRDTIDRRTVLRTLGVGGIAGIAGCTGSGGDGGDGGGDGDGGDSTTASNDGGSGGGGSSGDAEITLGLQADLTGPLSTYGFWFERVLNGYVAELNDADNGLNLELVVEDTATDGKQGATAFRKLAQQHEADFVIGSFSSGVNLATNPLAKQLKVPYFPSGSAPSTTGADGNRWVVRTAHNITQQAYLGVEWAVENLGTKWTVVYQDYAFGQQWLAALKEFLSGKGEIIAEIPVPIGTTDLNSYLNKVPDETEVLFSALILPSSINFLQQSADLNVPGQRFGDISSIEGVDIADIESAGQGASFLTGLPPALDSEANAHLREVAQVESAEENLVRQYWVAYEALSFIVKAVMESGWQSSDDHQSFIEWFETSPSVTESMEFPQGDKFIRGADHQAYMNRYISRISGTELETVAELELNEAPTEAEVDFTQESF